MICIIGAGIVGCASAYLLAREGHEVLLLDAASGPGNLCSFANGAQLSYSYVEPLATPATLCEMPKLLMRRDSPVRFNPTLDWRQYAWGLQFLVACRTSQVHRATRQLLQLSFLSRDTLDHWLRDGVWPVGFKRNGKLVLCRDDDTMARQQKQMQFQALLGCEQQALSVDQCLDKEPALLASVRRSPRAFVGGIWTPGECVVDTHALCNALVERFHDRGGKSLFNTRVVGFAQNRHRVHGVITTDGELACDTIVLTAGSDSAALAWDLGEYLPVYPIKGYSLTLPMRGTGPAPRISVTDLGRKTVFAPLGAELRVAAIAEIGGHGRQLSEGRIAQMRSSVAALYPEHVDARADGRPWAGLRPATPTSLPIVRRSKRHANVFFNVGHGALGLTLAAGSAVSLRQCMHEAGCR
jgi:D-amino-acid dehydrogenase